MGQLRHRRIGVGERQLNKAPQAKRFLGLDPGSRATGWGVIEQSGSLLRLVECGTIKPDTSGRLPQRLAALGRSVDGLMVRWRPDAVALESVFHGPNTRSLIVLAQARGALLMRLAERTDQIAEYSPAEIKQAVTGNGRADKTQVARMVAILLGRREVEASADATDALAVALCCAHRWRSDRLAAKALER